MWIIDWAHDNLWTTIVLDARISWKTQDCQQSEDEKSKLHCFFFRSYLIIIRWYFILFILIMIFQESIIWFRYSSKSKDYQILRKRKTVFKCQLILLSFVFNYICQIPLIWFIFIIIFNSRPWCSFTLLLDDVKTNKKVNFMSVVSQALFIFQYLLFSKLSSHKTIFYIMIMSS